MLSCPVCKTGLAKIVSPSGILWSCPVCHGRTTGIAQLRRTLSAETVNTLWQLARTGQYTRTRPCPSCDKPMSEVPVAAESETKWIDVCLRCHFVWLDSGEEEALPQAPPREPASADWELPPQARERLALMQLDNIRERAEADVKLPEESWKRLLGFLGLPVEYENQPLARTPWVTWLLAAVITLFSGLAFLNLQDSILTFGLIPADFGRMNGLTLITSFFLHGGVLHLVGNVYFLLVLGDNVEDDLGKARFVLLLLASTLVGNVLHILGDPRTTTPCIGASGGISGILTYYALKFPHAKLGVMFRLYFFPLFRWARMSALALFLFWLGLQLVGVYMQVAGFSNVSSLAHLGGAAAGLLAWLLWRRR